MISNKVLLDHLEARESQLNSQIAKNKRFNQSVLMLQGQLHEVTELRKEIKRLANLTAIMENVNSTPRLF